MPVIRLFAGSVFGTALETARDIEEALEDAGFDARLMENPSLSDFTADASDSAVLICTSTTGQGELPASILPLYQALNDSLPMVPGRPCGLIVLGDQSYGDSFCGAGTLFENLFQELGYQQTRDTLRIDAMETTEPAELAVPWALAWAADLNIRPDSSNATQ